MYRIRCSVPRARSCWDHIPGSGSILADARAIFFHRDSHAGEESCWCALGQLSSAAECYLQAAIRPPPPSQPARARQQRLRRQRQPSRAALSDRLPAAVQTHHASQSIQRMPGCHGDAVALPGGRRGRLMRGGGGGSAPAAAAAAATALWPHFKPFLRGGRSVSGLLSSAIQEGQSAPDKRPLVRLYFYQNEDTVIG